MTHTTSAGARTPRDDDKFVLSPRAATYVAFLNVGHGSDDATLLADYALAHPHKLLEDCKLSIAREWRAALAAPPQNVVEWIALDAETIQTLLDLLNPLHGSLDEQTYNEKLKENFDAPREYEHHVMVTWGQESDLSQAVCILEDRKSQIASGLVTVTHPDEAAIRADEREKCARVAERTPLNSYDAGECRADIAAAIRAGGV